MHQQIDVSKLVPNTWNPNVMPPELEAKLQNGIEQVYAKTKKIPPITVRPHPTEKGKFQIIDGYHRWSLMKKLGHDKIDAFVLPVDDSLARVLTATLNYIRGEPDPEKYPLLVAEAIQADPNLKLEDLAKLLPQTEDQLHELIESNDAALDMLAKIVEDRKKAAKDAAEQEEQDPDEFATISFTVPMSVAGIVEAELERISKCLEGKAKRMRALEYMAVNSALTPLDTVQTTVDTREKLRAKQEERKKEVATKSAGFTASDVAKTGHVISEPPKGSKKPKVPPKKGAKA